MFIGFSFLTFVTTYYFGMPWVERLRAYCLGLPSVVRLITASYFPLGLLDALTSTVFSGGFFYLKYILDRG